MSCVPSDPELYLRAMDVASFAFSITVRLAPITRAACEGCKNGQSNGQMLSPPMLPHCMQAKDRLQQLASHEAIISNTLSLMGLDVTDPQGLADELRALTLVRAELTESAISAAISERAEARKNKDFERSDALRLEFEGRGIGFQDTPTGTTWRPMVRPQ